MAWITSRVVEWKEREVQVIEIPIEGVPQGPPPNECERTYALVYAGHGRTDAGGRWRLSLPAISCLKPAPGGDKRTSIVATPTKDGHTDDLPRPYILVAQTTGADIEIRSFDTAGAEAPNVPFSWHCIVEGTLVQ